MGQALIDDDTPPRDIDLARLARLSRHCGRLWAEGITEKERQPDDETRPVSVSQPRLIPRFPPQSGDHLSKRKPKPRPETQSGSAARLLGQECAMNLLVEHGPGLPWRMVGAERRLLDRPF
jgi:hypothetical protein